MPAPTTGGWDRESGQFLVRRTRSKYNIHARPLGGSGRSPGCRTLWFARVRVLTFPAVSWLWVGRRTRKIWREVASLRGLEPPTFWFPPQADSIQLSYGCHEAINAGNCSRPLPDFRNLSRLMASAREAYLSVKTNFHGPRFLVDLVTPELCCPTRCSRSAVNPV